MAVVGHPRRFLPDHSHRPRRRLQRPFDRVAAQQLHAGHRHGVGGHPVVGEEQPPPSVPAHRRADRRTHRRRSLTSAAPRRRRCRRPRPAGTRRRPGRAWEGGRRGRTGTRPPGPRGVARSARSPNARRMRSTVASASSRSRAAPGRPLPGLRREQGRHVGRVLDHGRRERTGLRVRHDPHPSAHASAGSMSAAGLSAQIGEPPRQVRCDEVVDQQLLPRRRGPPSISRRRRRLRRPEPA